ncbi:MAG: MGMT family protein [Parcubacteria group bacterium]|nr:MGMT family protein [Parcubacteria group bacterium]
MKMFSEKVVEIARAIPEGRVTTYGRIARAAGGGAMASQSITNILSKARKDGGVEIPFHRIVYADGRVWINKSHRKERMKLYEDEGIEVDTSDRISNFADVLLEFE